MPTTAPERPPVNRENKELDREYNEGFVIYVQEQNYGWRVMMNFGIWIAIKSRYYNQPPRIGDVVRAYGDIISCPRGIDINGETLYYFEDSEGLLRYERGQDDAPGALEQLARRRGWWSDEE